MKQARKAAIVTVALTAAAILLRPQMSSALVMRGDELAYRGDRSRALVMYARAIAFDRDNGSAADRYAFQGAISHDAVMVERAVRVASAYLKRHPEDPTILADRALCYAILRDDVRAERDFAQAGGWTHDARSLTFAGFVALRAGRRARARAHFTTALHFDATYAPALRGLERT